MPSKDHTQATTMAESGAMLRKCFGGAILTVNHQCRIVTCTAAAKAVLGLKRDSTTLPEPMREIVKRCLATNDSILNQIISPRSKLTRTPLLVSAIPVLRDNQTEVIVVLHDLSPLDSIEQNLRRLDRLACIGTLSASMAHEIKNALVAVKTFVDLLLDRNRDAELKETVEREMRRIEFIVRQMLRFAAPARATFSSVRVHDVLEHSLRMVQRQIEEKLISLNRSFRAIPDYVHGDDYQLEQAFVNLLINAVEAMSPNGSLNVVTELISPGDSAHRLKSPHVRVTISDTGVGVTPENMRRLFEPFFTTKHDGTGLGLPITQRIVKEHHGDISVQSEPNKGTTFNILLPAHAKPH